MTNLTHLSDTELDAVTGGGFYFKNVEVATNTLLADQSQLNLAIDAGKLGQGGSQIIGVTQVAKT